MGRSILFLEGIHGQDFTSILNQGVLGGLIPGLMLGLRPWVNYAVSRFTEEDSKIPALVWHTLSAMGVLPLLKSQLDNLSYIFNAGPFYSIPAAVAEIPYQYQNVQYNTKRYANPPSLMNYYDLQLGGIAIGISLNLLTQLILGQPSEKLITITGDPSHYFFIKIQPGHFRKRGYSIEIQRIQLNAAPIPDPFTPFGRLALAMDKADTDSIRIIPKLSPTGSRLSLSFSKRMAAHQSMSLKNNNTLQLDLNFEQVRPWLESSLVEGSELFPGALPAGSYYSVFQSTILNHIADAITCSQMPEQCKSGRISSENVNYQLLYTPHNTLEIPPTSVWVSHSQNEQTARAPLGEGLTVSIPERKNTIALYSTYQHMPTVSHYWLPYSIGQTLLAETNALARYTGLHLTQSMLTTAAKRVHIPLTAPRWKKAEFYDISDLGCAICLDKETGYDVEEEGYKGAFYNCGANGKGCRGAMHKTCWDSYFKVYSDEAPCPSCQQKTSPRKINKGPGIKD
ncbi:hypothetical protein [Sansalvadorimonas verongulae]|uniref:hypothetical protein n=1 Tax=Sansalvadorimonas verongulae TaxID=2172824 RepID=UPI0012BBCD98|nr:hypothetical protein [Sansalvadorimonas verongulae]MTI12918.1 hypothetical protein [Sansalvadorimonas verongulae]